MADKKNSLYFAPEGSPVVPHPYDTRIRLKALMHGLFTKAELKRYLESLPDDAEHAVVQNFMDVVGADESGSHGS